MQSPVQLFSCSFLSYPFFQVAGGRSVDKKLKGGEKATTVKRNTRKHDAQGETTGHPLKWSSLGECLNPVSVGKSSVVFVTPVFQKITWIKQMRAHWESNNLFILMKGTIFKPS